MLSDWYFCCCLDSNPAQMQVFLSILETLENPESGTRLLLQAYDELQRTEVWTQVYAFPRVLESLYLEDVPETMHGAVKCYFEGLLAFLPEDLIEPYRRLLSDALTTDAAPADLMEAMITCTEAVKHLPQRSLTAVPYLDLKEFLPETLLLAVILDKLSHHRAFAADLHNTLSEGRVQTIQLLLQQAIEYRFGRLALRLAASIVHRASPDYPKDKLVDQIWRNTYCSPRFEPDILETTAEILYGDTVYQSDIMQRAKAAREIIEESVALTMWRDLGRAVPPNPAAESELIRRIGYDQSAEVLIKPSLHTVYWQMILLDLAARVEPQTTAETLVRFWRPPIGQPAERIKVQGPFQQPDIVAWWKQLQALLEVAGRGNVGLWSDYAKELSISGHAEWLLFSPWLGFDPSSTKFPYPPRYPTFVRPPVMIRLVASVFIAVRLLQQLSQDAPVRARFSALLGHAADVLEPIHRKWLYAEGSDASVQGTLDLSLQLTGLALFGDRHVKLAGCGHLESVPPDDFLQLLQADRQQVSAKALQDHKFFLEIVLPTVLMSWIADAYLANIGPFGAGRWYDLVPAVYHYFRTTAKGSIGRSIEPTLLIRFLHADYPLDLSKFNWREAKDKNDKLMQWAVPARRLLLTEKLSVKEWMPDWPEPADWEARPYSPATRLVRALERLAALEHSIAAGDLVPREIADAWRTDWQDHLNRINSNRDLDRFVRLRLLELLSDDEVLQDSADGQELIALTLLEYGGAYELKQLLGIVYPADREGRLAVASAARQQVRISLLRAMIREARMRQTAEEDWVNARDPRHSLIDRQKTELITNMICRIAYFERTSPQQTKRSRLVEVLVKQEQESYQRLIGRPVRSLRTEIEMHTATKKNIILPEEEKEIQNWHIQAAVQDPNRLTATLVVDNLDATGLRNLFEESRDEVEALRRQRPGPEMPEWLLATVVHVEGSTGQKWRYTFNCGFPFYLSHESSADLSLAPGMYIGIPVSWDPRARDWRVWPPEAGLRSPERQRGPGEIIKLAMQETAEGASRFLRIRWGQKDMTAQLEPTFWDVDTSRRFCNLPNDTWPAYAQLCQDRVWRPVDRDLASLLVHAFRYDQGTTTILALIGPVTHHGEAAWRFASRPGDNYLIYRHDFLPEDAETLELEIARHGDAAGLLVTLTAEEQDGLVRLRLARVLAPDTERDSIYPALKAPFDQRNLDWRVALPLGHAEVAYRRGPNWYADIAPKDQVVGFPTHVRVEWLEQYPDARAWQADFTVEGWDWRSITVQGNIYKVYRITLKDDDADTWQDFLNRWANPQRQDIISLDKVLGKISTEDGGITCRTIEGILVRVQAESLTMQLLAEDAVPPVQRNRPAEIIVASWRPPRTHMVPQVTLEDIPESAWLNDKCEGLLVETPEPQAAATRCVVIWKTAAGHHRAPLIIHNLSELDARPGRRLTGIRRADRCTFDLEFLFVQARALWSLEEWKGGTQGLTHLGPVFYNKEHRFLAEVRPGELALLPARPGFVPHLSIGDGIGFRGGLTAELPVTDSARGARGKQRDDRRAVLSFQRKLLIGECFADTPVGPNLVMAAFVRLDKSKNAANRFDLSRVFRLEPARQKERPERVKQEGPDTQQWADRLAAYLREPTDRRVTVTDKGIVLRDRELKVPLDFGRTQWSYGAPIAPGEGPFVLEASYVPEGTARLFEDPTGRIMASFRQVHALSPEEYQRSLTANFRDLVPLEPRLYYVGREQVVKIDPISGAKQEETYHRFEWGYGKMLLASENQLRMDDKPFKDAQLLLFHGDAITKITFLPIELVISGQAADTTDEWAEPDSGDSNLSHCIISIRSYDLSFSQATSLYLQRHRYKIVHLLHLLISKPEIKIEYVEGFDENRSEADGTRRFDRIRSATVAAESHAHLLQHLASADPEDESGPIRCTILGRLDEEVFRTSLGQTITFDHVRLSFDRDGDGEPLHDGELVFMKAGKIVPLTNDMALQLAAPDALPLEDIGLDMKKGLLLLRRNFSMREDLLRRLYDDSGEDGWAGRILLVRLGKEADQAPRSSLLRNDRPMIPTRKTRALSGAIGASEELFLAAVVNSENDACLLELQPGVFVRLDYDDIESIPADLPPGTILRIENGPNGVFRIARAAFSDARYVPDGVRPVVTLPKDHLLKDDLFSNYDVGSDVYWLQNRRSFTIGGLSNIVAWPGTYDEEQQTWQPPRAFNFRALMQTPHPKLAYLGQDRQQQFRIGVAGHAAWWTAGWLDIREKEQLVRLVPLRKTADDPQSHPLEWRRLTFALESVTRVISRARQEKWRYHDSKSGTWPAQKGKIIREQLWDHSGPAGGPLFFEATDSCLQLRYTPELFLRFGFPIDALVDSLSMVRGKSATYAVAGYSDAGGLWIELAPGRIVEVPAQLMVWRAGGREKTLTLFNWRNFAPGDQIEMRSAATSPLKIDRVALLKWRPGPRGAFGPHCVFLPVQPDDGLSGGIRLGAGDFTFVLPEAEPQAYGPTVILYANNHMENAGTVLPEQGDVVLLGLDDAGALQVLGLPGLKPQPDNKQIATWENDPLDEDIRVYRDRQFNPHRLQGLIAAAGGALPVTVEWVHYRDRILYFSRHYQLDACILPAETLNMARVVGLMPDNKTVLLRSGSGFIKMPLNWVISGLPTKFYPAAAEILQRTRAIIWLRGGPSGALSAGMHDETSREIAVNILDVATCDLSAGMICRAVDSQALYWLPADAASWTPLTPEQMRRVFVDSKREQRVRLMDRANGPNWVSLTDVLEVDREFQKLAIGKELIARIIEQDQDSAGDDVKRYLVESFSSKIVLACESHGSQGLENGKLITAEVIRRVPAAPRTVTVAPVGQRQYTLDLPGWMLDTLPEPGQLREAMRAFLTWWRADPSPLDPSVNPKEMSEEDLAEALCRAYRAGRAPGNLRFQVKVADEWISRNLPAREMDTHYALIAALLLYRNANRRIEEIADILNLEQSEADSFARDWQSRARVLVQNLGRRALRSRHVEVLARQVFCHPTNRRRSDRLWRRLAAVEQSLHGTLKEEDIAAIRQFRKAVEVRDQQDLRIIADALSAATGQCLPASALYLEPDGSRSADVTTILSRIYRTMPLSRSGIQAWLDRQHEQELVELLGMITRDALDITLLDPLPVLEG